MKTQVIGIRLSEDQLAELDRWRGDVPRAKFAAELVAARLGFTAKPAPKVLTDQPREQELLTLLAERRMSSRDAAQHLGMSPGLFSKIERRLMNARLIRVENGVLVCTEN